MVKSSWELDIHWQLSLRKPGHCYNPWLQNNVTCLSYSFIPCRTWTEGSGLHVHTSSCLQQLLREWTNPGSWRHPSFVRDWKWNRWEIKCRDWPDLVDDCCLNSWNWNWAFYTLADAQDTICHSLDGNMDQVACHIKYQFSGNTHDPLCIELEGKIQFVRKSHQISSEGSNRSSQWLITAVSSVWIFITQFIFVCK